MTKQINLSGDNMPNIDTISSQIEKLTVTSSFWGNMYLIFFGITALATFACVFSTVFVNKRSAELNEKKDEKIRLLDEQNKLHIAKVQAEAKEFTADVEATANRKIEETRAEADVKIEDAKASAAKANEGLAKAHENTEALRKQNLELESKVEKERSGRLEMETVIAPRTMEQRQTAKQLELFSGISVIVESLAESEPWRTAGQIAWTLNKAKWDVLPGMQRFLDATGFFDGVAIEANVGARSQEDRSSEAADALVEVLTKNNIQANRRPAINLPLNTIRIRVGLKPAGYFQRNRKDLEYGNMLYR
jgi:hypothetical protein